MLAVVLSLTAAVTFARSAMAISGVQGRVGVFQLGRWQMGMAFVLAAASSLAVGGWQAVTGWQFGMLTASAVTGIMLATSTYIASIHAAGPRITALLFSLTSPFALLLGYVFLGETVTLTQSAGIALILSGIVLAILAEKAGDSTLRRPLWQGIALGVVTAMGQAMGSLLARPAMEQGVEPFTAMAIRSGLGLVFFTAIMVLPMARAVTLPAPRDLLRVGVSAVMGMYLGMTLMMAALATGDVGIVATLTSTTPILILPLLWFTTRRAPGLWAWAGAVLAVAGTALISLQP